MFSFRNDPGAGSAGVAFCDAVGPDGDTLDLSVRSATSERDWGRLAAALDVRLLHASQVHGTTVLEVGQDSRADEVAATQADALLTTDRRVGLAVRVADCVPVLLADPDAGVVAAAHAGRVGLAAGVLTTTLERMREHGATRVTAWIGPHVCGACYEVPEQLRDEIAAVLPGAAARTSWGTASLDLGMAAERQLAAAGRVVERHDPCTRTTPTLHSHRRDGAASGRQAGIVWLA